MPSASPPPRPAEALRVLLDHEVDFLVVGMVAAVLQGVPAATFDVDIVHRRTPENVERLMRFLASVDATYRDRAGRRLPPDARSLLGTGHNPFRTSLGDLDALGALHGGRGYTELEPRSVVMKLGGVDLRVLSLEALIEEKERLGREKDLAVLPLLRRTLALGRGK